MLQQWHCRLKKDVSWQEEHSNQRQRSFCAFYRKFCIFYRKLTKKPNWSPKRTWRLGICPWGLHSSMFPLLTPFPSFFSCHYASFLQTVFSTRCSIFLQETSCRTFGRAKFNLKNESNGGNLWIRPTSTDVSIPCLSPSFVHLLVPLIVLLEDLPVEIVGN